MPVAKALKIMAVAEKVMQKGSYHAQGLRVPLVTSGKRMLRDFPQTAVIRFQFANS